MFEAVVALCLDLAAGPCRDRLLPGYEAPTAAACAARLAADPPPADPPGLRRRGAPACRPAGPALSVEEVAPGVYVHAGLIEEPGPGNRGDVANLGFVVGTKSVAVIDSGTAPWVGEALWRAIRARTDLPVSHVVLTHVHPDHVFGAGVFAAAGARLVAHAALPRALADRHGTYLNNLAALVGQEEMVGAAVPRTGLTVAEGTEIDLGGRVLALTAWPAAHTTADLTVLDRRTGTLFAGDLVFDRHTPSLDGSLAGWRRTLDALAATGAARIVPGHGRPALDPEAALAPLARYLAVLEADTRAALDRGARLSEAVDVVAASERPFWKLFDAYNPRNATVAYTELEWE